MVCGSSAHAEMRPSGPRPRPRFRGFLRSRGDAPESASVVRLSHVVPPLTRRCALVTPRVSVTRPGSSAHAEMRRDASSRRHIAHGFLRSRGDAPLRRGQGWRRCEVPPLTRRCAVTGEEIGPELYGSSAHAEMRPADSACRLASARFLRSRGDAPIAHRHRHIGTGVPPLTRRCAERLPRPRDRGRGSSAHAEMRPIRCTSLRRARGFLRSRGDAPTEHVYTEGFLRVPPLTRRCAPPPLEQTTCTRGSSAHAEMRPSCRRSRSRSRRFLRSRGDAPTRDGVLLRFPPVPPLTRRCARCADASG